MKKAIQVMATLVAFLLSGQAFAIKVYPTMPPIKDVIGGTATIVADGVKVTGSTGLFGPEFIPNPINKALALVPETTIASAAISSMAKKLVVGGVAGIAAGYAFDEMIKGVGWVMTDGAVSKPSAGPPVPVSGSGQYSWSLTGYPSQYSDAMSACPATDSGYGVSAGLVGAPIASNGVSAACRYTGAGTPVAYGGPTVYRSGNSCPSGSTYSVSSGGCVGAPGFIPVTATDLSVLDGFVKNKNGTWQRDLTTQLCGGLETCYQSLSPSTVLTGPSTITGSPQTVTTTAPDGSVSTTVKSPTTTVTYGPNWYDYNPVTTTTTTNNGGTTTTTDNAPDTFPNVPDMLGGGNDGLKGIKDGISGTTSSTSPIPYMAWYSFSQQCHEITLIIPVYGSFSTAICPVYATYIWPTLYFFFAVFTWIRCWGIWRDTVLRVRAS